MDYTAVHLLLLEVLSFLDQSRSSCTIDYIIIPDTKAVPISSLTYTFPDESYCYTQCETAINSDGPCRGFTMETANKCKLVFGPLGYYTLPANQLPASGQVLHAQTETCVDPSSSLVVTVPSITQSVQNSIEPSTLTVFVPSSTTSGLASSSILKLDLVESSTLQASSYTPSGDTTEMLSYSYSVDIPSSYAGYVSNSYTATYSSTNYVTDSAVYSYTTAYPSSSYTTGTPPQVTAPTTCKCSCDIYAQLQKVSPYANLTAEEKADAIEAKIEQVQKELTVDKAELSSTTRTKISADDSRTSATAVGYILGVVTLTCVFGAIVLADVPVFIEQAKQLFKRLKSIFCRHD